MDGADCITWADASLICGDCAQVMQPEEAEPEQTIASPKATAKRAGRRSVVLAL